MPSSRRYRRRSPAASRPVLTSSSPSCSKAEPVTGHRSMPNRFAGIRAMVSTSLVVIWGRRPRRRLQRSAPGHESGIPDRGVSAQNIRFRAQHPQVATPGCPGEVIGRQQQRARGAGGDVVRRLPLFGSLANGIGQGQQVIRIGRGCGSGKFEADHVPPPGHGKAAGMLCAEVIAVRFRVKRQRAQDRRGIRVDVRKGGNSCALTG